MTDHEEHEEDQETWQEGAEEDQEEDTEVPAEEEPQPNPALEKINAALHEIFEVYQDPETSTIPVDRMVEILRAIGQPIPEGAAALEDFIFVDGPNITVEGTQAYVMAVGVANRGTAIKATTYATLSKAKAFLSSALEGFNAQDSLGPARFTVGNTDNAQSGWAFHMDRRPTALDQFPMEEKTTSVFSFSVRVRDASSEAFLRAMATQTARITTAMMSALGNVSMRAHTAKVHDDIIRVSYLIDVADASSFTLVDEIIELLAHKINAFSFTSQWGASIDNILTASLDDLLCADLHITLDTLPISAEYWGQLRGVMAPQEELGWVTIEDAYRDIPGLEALLNGNMQAHLDLSGFVEKQLQKGKALIGDFVSVDTSSNTMSLLRTVAPFLVMMVLDDSSGVSPAAQIDAMAAFTEMMRLMVTRDVTEFCGFEWRARNGFGVRIDTNGLFKFDSIFDMIGNVWTVLAEAANGMNEDTIGNQLMGMFEGLAVSGEGDGNEQFPDESAFDEE